MAEGAVDCASKAAFRPDGEPFGLTSRAIDIRERFPASVIEVAALADAQALAAALGEILGTAVSTRSSSAAESPQGAALCIGPARWIVLGDAAAHDARLAAIRGLPRPPAAVFDLSHGRGVLELRGAGTRELLSMGCQLDWDSPALAPPCACATLLAHCHVVLHARAPDAIDLLVPRSYATSLTEWLSEALAAPAP